MLIYTKSLNTENCYYGKNNCFQEQKKEQQQKKNKKNTACWIFYSEQAVSLAMERVTVIVLLSKNEPPQELTHEGLQNT